jgi:hypothetical protein
LPAVTGRSVQVKAGDDLQAAIDAAQLGDELVLQAGATFTGTFVLRPKSGSGWLTIRSSGVLPAEGTRIMPADAPKLARLVATDAFSPVIKTEAGAHHYRLVGLEVTAKAGAVLGYTLVSLGDASVAQNTVALEPHDLVLDRMYIHGTPTLDFQRCVALNSAATAIIDSWLSECHGKGKDSQAIAGWNGTGPYKIVNNRLEGAGENVMFGGADPKIPNGLPEDIEIRGNHFIKPLEWKGVWEAKNLLEIKIGRRILVENNVFENSWADAQNGFALLFKSVNQEGTAPWSETRDLTVRYNLVRNSAQGMTVAGHPESFPVVPASRMLITQNIFERIGTNDSDGRLLMVMGVDDLTFTQNTGTGTNSFLVLTGDTPDHRLTITDNVFTATTYGLSGDGAGSGQTGLDARAPGWTFRGNIAAGVKTVSAYPAGNQYPATTAEIGFVDYLAGNFGFLSTSIAMRPDGTHAGADYATLQTKIAGVVR